MNRTLVRRVSSLLEVLGLFFAGPIVGWLLRRALGITMINPLDHLTIKASDAELLIASRQMFTLLAFQYVGSFLLIVSLNWWRGRRSLASYGLTKGGRSWTMLLTAGLVTAALATWPVLAVGLLNSIHPSQTVAWRQAFFDMSWLRWQFWLFSAVASWALIPVAEELLFRGYYQRRLAEDWGNGPAIAASACLFTFAHTQYQIPNLYSLGMILGLLAFAVGFGIVFAFTGSLVPSILAHAVINFPMTLPWQAGIVIALMAGALISWRYGVSAGRVVFSHQSLKWSLPLGVIGALSAAAAARLDIFAFAVGPVMILSAAVIMAVRRDSAAHFAAKL